MAENKKRIFNLLKPVAPPKTSWDKIYDWLVDKARIVLLIAELFIVFSFVGKVVVDLDAKNKTEQIDDLRGRLGIREETVEPEYREIQKKGINYVKLWENSSNYALIIDEVYSYINNPLEEVTIRIIDKNLYVFGNAKLSVLSSLEDSLQVSDTFKNAYIDLRLNRQEIVEGRGDYVLIAPINEEVLTRDPIIKN